ncbi:uncharacterized protein LOC134691692 [Mytilus trossulus]|uniref:uncharacterized protein LOC134691692 n=1 Tax=Mytilus trossulus TaxID=6551 RepID=UPI0030058D1E
MNRQAKHESNADDKNPVGIKKTTYWEIYGVKRFPYPGKRKFAPLLNQSLGGGMVISNDVFGLTISQFERMYKSCLETRKTKEQWILNLRYPDKSSGEYLEYLENCTDCSNDHLRWIDPKEKYMYELLVQTVGSEIDIRTRQRLFIIQDMIYNVCTPPITQISSGSLSEGFDLPGSDIDIMYVCHHLDVVQNVSNIKHPNYCDTFVMETAINHPGFTRLRLVAKADEKSVCNLRCFNCPPGTCTGNNYYLHVNAFLNSLKALFNSQVFVHGPCMSNEDQTMDIAYCIRSKYLPQNAIPWASRHRSQWPPSFLIDRIINYGCLLVPIGPNTVSGDSLWRVSFSMAEKLLVHSFNFTQLLCYGLLKLALKRIVNTNTDIKELLCSYFLKTALFWVSEELDIEIFKLSKLYYCFSLCLDKLISWVNKCYCPNYFIPEHNMFIGKINQSNNKILLCVLESIQFGGIAGLTTSVVPPDKESHCVLSTNRESPSITLDFLFYRVNTFYWEFPIDLSSCYKRLVSTKSLLNFTSSLFLSDACKYHYANINQMAAQLLPSPNTLNNKNNKHKRYHKHLQDGIKTDAVSGWLLYASFYYVTGQFNITLRLTDFVLSRCSPIMVFHCDLPSCGHRNMYKQNIHSSMTLNDRMRMAIIRNVRFCKDSSLIPGELRLEVERTMIKIPPVVMLHCLRFLCYHHLGDIINREKSLRDLYTTVKYKYLIQSAHLSDSIIIVGVCYEISGDKDTAYQCYEEALKENDDKSSTAQIRKSKLEGSYCGL